MDEEIGSEVPSFLCVHVHLLKLCLMFLHKNNTASVVGHRMVQTDAKSFRFSSDLKYLSIFVHFFFF